MSQQYRLEALGEPVFVGDLGITVTRHEVWIDKADFAASDCLRALIRIGRVRVSSGERVRVPKEPPKRKLPTWVARSRPNKRGKPVSPHPAQQPTPPPQQTFTAEEAQGMADHAAEKAAKTAINALMPAIHLILANQQNSSDVPSDLDTRIEQAVSRALGSVSLTAPSGSTTTPRTGPDEPMFIPSGIVKEDAESLTVKSDSAQSEGLDDAASALKALRKGKGGDKT